MKTLQLYLICLICGGISTITFSVIKIEKQLKELKEIKLIVDNLESQLKLLTPPPEFMQLPILRKP